MSDTDDADVLRELASLPDDREPAGVPDGETVALYYDVTGRNELHLLDPRDGNREQLSDGEVPRSVRRVRVGSVGRPALLPSGRGRRRTTRRVGDVA